MGHTKVRCKQPVPTEDIDGDAGDNYGGPSQAMNDHGGDQTTDDYGAGQQDWAPTAGGW